VVTRRAAIAGLGAVGFGGIQPPPMNAPPGGAQRLGVQPGTFNPVVEANRVLVFGANGGIFVYSGTPAAGNLIESIAAVSAHDLPGNLYLAGAVSYFNTGSGFLACQTSAGQITFYTAVTEAGPWTARSTIANDPSNSLTLNSPNAVSLQSAAGGGILVGSTISLQATTILGSTFFLYASDPAIGGQETWHDQTGNLFAGWAGAAAPANPRVKLLPAGHFAYLNGTVSHAAFAGASNILTLPAAYAPATIQAVLGYDQAARIVEILIASTGIVSTSGAGAGTTTVYFNGSYPLD